MWSSQRTLAHSRVSKKLAVRLSVWDAFMDVVHEHPDITVHLILFNATISEGTPQRIEYNDVKWSSLCDIPNHDFCPVDEEIIRKL